MSAFILAQPESVVHQHHHMFIPVPTMNTLRNRLAVALVAVATLFALPTLVHAQAVTQTAETQAALTPQDALDALMAGNERFIDGAMLERDLTEQVAITGSGQYPHSVILSCIDSRVPPELVFDQGLGDIFSPRIAGNFVNADILGSMEFATAAAGSKLIVVLGHTECGAVKGACDNVELGNLTQTLSNISPAVYATEIEGPRNSQNKDFVNAVSHNNVAMTVQNILDRSAVIRGQVEAGEVMVVGAMYNVATGEVTLVDGEMGSHDHGHSH